MRTGKRVKDKEVNGQKKKGERGYPGRTGLQLQSCSSDLYHYLRAHFSSSTSVFLHIYGIWCLDAIV